MITIKIIIVSFVASLISFWIGVNRAEVVASNNFKEVFNWMVTCDLPLNDSANTIIEVDCMTPEAYETANDLFDQGWDLKPGFRVNHDSDV